MPELFRIFVVQAVPSGRIRPAIHIPPILPECVQAGIVDAFFLRQNYNLLASFDCQKKIGYNICAFKSFSFLLGGAAWDRCPVLLSYHARAMIAMVRAFLFCHAEDQLVGTYLQQVTQRPDGRKCWVPYPSFPAFDQRRRAIVAGKTQRRRQCRRRSVPSALPQRSDLLRNFDFHSHTPAGIITKIHLGYLCI
nr:MAG TPA: hypothetical protein [Caudoviricetes sp.]